MRCFGKPVGPLALRTAQTTGQWSLTRHLMAVHPIQAAYGPVFGATRTGFREAARFPRTCRAGHRIWSLVIPPRRPILSRYPPISLSFGSGATPPWLSYKMASRIRLRAITFGGNGMWMRRIRQDRWG